MDISNTDDIIDSRDVIKRIEELREERDDAPEDFCGSDEEELEALESLADECEGYGDWSHGETLIRDSYFEDYARELARDIGAISGDESWPLDHIDWDAASESLKVDYMSADYDGVEYWLRA